MINKKNKQLEYERIVNNGLKRLELKSIIDNPCYNYSTMELVKNMQNFRRIFIITFLIAIFFGIRIFVDFRIFHVIFCLSGFSIFGYISINYALDFIESKNILAKRLKNELSTINKVSSL